MTSSKFDLDLRALVEAPGPYLSVYLNTEARTEDGPDEIALRWRRLRDVATRSGATQEALAPIDDLVHDAHIKGDGLAAFVASGGLRIRKYLPGPIADEVSYGSVPSLVPLIDWHQDNPRFAVVLANRQGAEVHVVIGDESEAATDVEGIDSPIQKVKKAGWAQRRVQQRAENTWEQNAKEVANHVVRLVANERFDLIVVAGDVRAVQFLQENLGTVESIAFDLPSEPYSIDDIKEDIERAAAAHTAAATKAIVEKFHEERGQSDLAVEGAAPTFQALSKAQVDTLLLARDLIEGTAWFSKADLTQTAVDKGALTDLGLDDVTEGPMPDVAVRTALGTGARIRVLPSLPRTAAPAEGIGGILRYAG